MRKKLFFLLISLISGIGIFTYFEAYNFLFVIIGLFVCGILFLFKKSSLSFLFFGFSLGIFLAFFSFSSYKLDGYENLDLNLTVLDKIKNKDSYTYYVKATNKIENIGEKSSFISDKNFEIGDRIRANCDISWPNSNTNPFLFSYRKYLLSKKIKTKLDIKSYENLGQSSSIFLKIKRNFRAYIDKIFGKNLSKESFSFVKAVILSEKFENRDDLSKLGLAHILAISGLHIDLLMSLILYVLIRSKISYKLAYPISLVLCLFYAYLISFPFSVLRVLIIYSLSFLAFLFKKGKDMEKNLILAMLIILFINPFAIFNAGFFLSFLAGFAIYAIYPSLVVGKKYSYLKKYIIFIGILQITLAFHIIYYYGYINLLSFFANFVIVPIFSIALYIIFAIIFLYPLMGGFLSIFFIILDFLIKSILDIIRFLNAFTIFSIDFPKESILISFYYLILLFILVRFKNKKLRARKFLIISMLVLIFSIVRDKNKPISYQMLDIGQGDFFIIEDKNDFYLFDCGEIAYKNYSSSEKIAIPYLKARGVKKIKAVFISHEDKDHVGGLDKLNKEFDVGPVISNKYNKNLGKKYDFLEMKEGDVYKGKNFTVECLENFSGEENSNSMPLLIRINNFKILTMGDLPGEFEEKVARDIDILKVSHHGSKYSTSKKFVKLTSPKVALISSGRKNSYGHPSKEVLENLKNIRTYNTQVDGFCEIDFYKNSFKVKKYVKGGFFRWIIRNLWQSFLIKKVGEFI